MQFVKAEVGLVNAGATCYMNATLQAFLQDPDFRDSFRYGEAKIQYDNRLINLSNYYINNKILSSNWATDNYEQNYNNLQNFVVNQRLNILAGQAKYDTQGNADWSGAPAWAITEMKLILKCFANADVEHDIFNKTQVDVFYTNLKNLFGPNCNNLPSEAIDMSYELFLLSNQVDSIVKKTENGGQVKTFFKPQRFKDFMSVKNPLFKGIAANDAKDLVNFLIMTWHGEQNKAKLQQNKNPAEIASCINCLVQQINVYINNLKDNYSICKMALSNNNQWLADYWLLNVYSCKRNIQYHINEILQFAQMINNLDRDKKHQVNTSTIMQAAQSLLSAIGGYGGINDFCGDFTYMFQCANNIFNCASVVSNNQNNQMEILDQQDKQKAFNYFATNFTANNQSSISDKLYGVNYSVTTCSKCRIKSYNYQTYFFIVFPLEEVRRCKNIQGKTVTLHDCFEYDGKLNVMDGQNSMYCNYCKQNGPSTMQTSLTTTPKNLVLLFNRGKGKEFDIDINCPEFFDQHDIGENFLDSDQKYTIKHAYSTIKHSGESGMGGHFFMDGISERDGSLNRYNDGAIQKVDKTGMPYLVFCKDMQPDEMLNCVSQKVSTDKNLNKNLEAIAVKFSELGQLDIEKTNKNESRRLRFSYLLMQAILPDLTENQREYKPLADHQAKNLICAIFDLIKDEKNFNDDAMENYRTVIQSEKESIRMTNEEVDVTDTTKSKSKFSWLKFVLAAIFVVGTIVAIVFEFYILAAGLLALAILSLFAPKLCKSCCGCLPIVSSYVKDDNHDLDGDSYIENIPNLFGGKNYSQIE